MKGEGGKSSLRRIEKQDWIDSAHTEFTDKPFNTQATLGTTASLIYNRLARKFVRIIKNFDSKLFGYILTIWKLQIN